jgi:hypothetical protein
MLWHQVVWFGSCSGSNLEGLLEGTILGRLLNNLCHTNQTFRFNSRARTTCQHCHALFNVCDGGSGSTRVHLNLDKVLHCFFW